MTAATTHPNDPMEDTQRCQGICEQILLTVPDVAALCGVSEKTVRRWIETERLPTIRPMGHGARPMKLIARKDLDAWIEEHRSVHVASPDAHKPSVTINGRRFMRSKN
tara:strand:+ start:28025 stop:28348 length:324 start_codon:yes stop_codon:yes gene_type:complete